VAGEERARRILEKELEQKVTLHDDGSMPGMYDLRIGPADKPRMAIECVGAVDASLTEAWNVGPGRGPLELALTGDWIITLTPSARVKAIKRHIQPLLRWLESRGFRDVRVDHELKWRDAALFVELKSLGVTRVSCYRLPGTGTVHLGMEGIGGAVDSLGVAVPGLVGEFLRDSARRDVLRKLQRSGAADRHAFVLVGFAGAPWSVESYLTGDLDQLPVEGPDLPPPATGVWMVSVFGQRGLRWGGRAWRIFEARGEGIDD